MYLLASADAQMVQMPVSAVVALVGAVVALAMIVPKVVDYLQTRKTETKPEPQPDPMLPILAELTRALKDSATADGRLANVLERMEDAIQREMGKVETTLAEHGRQLQGLDYRTKETLKNVEGLPGRLKEIVAAELKEANDKRPA